MVALGDCDNGVVREKRVVVAVAPTDAHGVVSSSFQRQGVCTVFAVFTVFVIGVRGAIQRICVAEQRRREHHLKCRVFAAVATSPSLGPSNHDPSSAFAPSHKRSFQRRVAFFLHPPNHHLCKPAESTRSCVAIATAANAFFRRVSCSHFAVAAGFVSKEVVATVEVVLQHKRDASVVRRADGLAHWQLALPAPSPVAVLGQRRERQPEFGQVPSRGAKRVQPHSHGLFFCL
mmetsp:Transcript_36718/g.62392  ORF Transcript_36718/g.62392 Transcript_36718/m.62392 type:complete len:232 (-) Transcript_36718:205-900(-)